MGPQEMLDRAEVKSKWQLTPLKNFKSPRLTERMWRTALVVLITSVIYEYPLGRAKSLFCTDRCSVRGWEASLRRASTMELTG